MDFLGKKRGCTQAKRQCDQYSSDHVNEIEKPFCSEGRFCVAA